MRHATQIRETLANLRMRARRGWELVIIWIVVQWTGGGKQFVRRAGGSVRGLLPKPAMVGSAAPRAPSPELEKHCPSLKIERPARAERRALPFAVEGLGNTPAGCAAAWPWQVLRLV